MRIPSRLFATAFLATLGFSPALAAGPAFVDVKNGDNANAGTGCQQTAPCADLNTALSVIGPGGVVVVLSGGIFGPIVLNATVTILGTDLNELTNVIADPAAQVGCIGHLPGSCGLTNNGYGIEVAAGASDTVTLRHLAVRAAPNAPGALKLTSAGGLNLSYDVFQGGGTGVAVALYPNDNAPAQVYFAFSEISGSNHTAASGAIEVKPSGSTDLNLHFNHVQVHNSAFGIRTDGSQLTGTGNHVTTLISDSEFFIFDGAAMNAFSTSGTGLVNAVFDNTRVLASPVGLKANGPQSTVVLSNNLVSGNGTGILATNGATMFTAGDNKVKGNGVDVSGSLTPITLQ